jgi:putative FmdB family regulatory protein
VILVPIYEFQCNECKQIASFFTRTVADKLEPVCPSCGSVNLQRRISSFAYHKTTQQIHEESGPPSMFGNNPEYYKDPRNIGRHTEQRLKELGINMNTDDTFKGVRETIAAAREGELPQSLKDNL